MQELSRNDRPLCYSTRIPCQLQHAYRVNYKMRTVSIIKYAHRAGTCSFTVLCKSNESKFRGNLPKLCGILKKANFCRYFHAPIIPISLKFRANVRNFAWHFVPRTTKFCATVYLRSEILWNILFVGVEIKLNVDEIRVVSRTIFKRSSVH